MSTPEEFIKGKAKALEEEFLFLTFCYEDFKSKNSSLPISEINKLFHEKMLQHLKDESFKEETYRFFMVYLDMDIKLPSLLDAETKKEDLLLEEDDELQEVDLAGLVKRALTSKPERIVVDPCSPFSGSRFGGC